MQKQCLWNKKHLFYPNHRCRCDFLCEKCNKEIYEHYRVLYSPEQFKENIDMIKKQRKLAMERDWTVGESRIVKIIGLDMLVKIALFDNNLV